MNRSRPRQREHRRLTFAKSSQIDSGALGISPEDVEVNSSTILGVLAYQGARRRRDVTLRGLVVEGGGEIMGAASYLWRPKIPPTSRSTYLHPHKIHHHPITLLLFAFASAAPHAKTLKAGLLFSCSRTQLQQCLKDRGQGEDFKCEVGGAGVLRDAEALSAPHAQQRRLSHRRPPSV